MEAIKAVGKHGNILKDQPLKRWDQSNPVSMPAKPLINCLRLCDTCEMGGDVNLSMDERIDGFTVVWSAVWVGKHTFQMILQMMEEPKDLNLKTWRRC